MTKPPFAAFSSETEIQEIGEGMVGRSLPVARWTHAAHFAATVWILTRRPDLEAERDMPGLIAAYNLSRGGINTDEAGYHETITQASIRATRAFLAELPAGTSLLDAVNALVASPLGRSDWLLSYWSKETLFSVAARRGWIEADLTRFPF
jgi:hypothetical protein